MPVTEVDTTRNTIARSRGHARLLRTGGLASAVVVALLSGCAQGADDNANIVRTTTSIAGAAVVGFERDTRDACALPTAPDRAAGTREVAQPTGGSSDVPADPQRIVVLDTAALDAACSVGLWERVVGATTSSGPEPQPTYMGTGVQKIPSVGRFGSPDIAAITALHPDLILGSTDSGATDALRGVAPTVLVGPGDWETTFTHYAEGMDRSDAGARALADYRTDARETGTSIGASLSQASVARFSATDIQIQGNDTFAGRVLADAGVQRPTAQRGPSFGVGALDAQSERDKLEGDIVYLLFDGPEGKSRGEEVMDGDDWDKLGAVADKRDFAVDDTIWHGSGVTAARAILTDLHESLNSYVTD